MQPLRTCPFRGKSAAVALVLGVMAALAAPTGGGRAPTSPAGARSAPGTGESRGWTAVAQAQRTTDAETGGPGMEVKPLFDGWYDPGRWVPLSVAMRNSGGDMIVELKGTTTSTRSTFSTSVDLPQGSDKQVPLLIQPGGAGRVHVGLFNGITPVAEQSANLKPTGGEPLVVVIGDPSTQLEGVEAIGHSGRPIVVSAAVAELPENALGWGSVDFVVLAGADLSRANELQRKALAQWVALGGELVITGGPGATAVLAALPESLRPATAAGARDAGDFGTLAALAGGEEPVGSAPIAVLAPAPGAVPIAPLADGAPLMVQRRHGDGAVVVLAFDPALPPFSNWGGADDLWSALHVQRGETLWSSPPADLGQLGQGLSTLPEFELPSLKWLLVLIAVYIALVGPVNYLVLRRRRRLDLAWVTIPALTLLFSGLTYGAGFMIHGRELVLYELSAVRVIPDAGVAHVRTYVGLFSPGSSSYDVRIADALAQEAASSGMPVDAIQGLDGGVQDFPVEQWALGSFAAEAVVDWPGADPGRMTVESTSAQGIISNPFGQAVEEAAIFMRGGAAPIGRWAAAEARDASVPLDEGAGVGLSLDPATRDPATRAVQAGILSTAFGYGGGPGDMFQQMNYSYGSGSYSGGNYLGTQWVNVRDSALVNSAVVYGWSELPPLSVDVAGRLPTRRVYTLVHARVPAIRKGLAKPGPVLTGIATERSDASQELCNAGGAIFENGSQGRGLGATIDPAEFRFEFGLESSAGEPLWVELNGPPAIAMQIGSQVVSEVKVSMRPCDGEDWLVIGDGSFGADGQVPLPPEIQAAAGERRAICVRLEPVIPDPAVNQIYYEANPQSCWEPRLVTIAPESAPAETEAP